MSKNLYPNSIRIGLMDPSIAQTWAQRILSDGTTVGSIKKGDTINHTTSQPIATGLFCQRIFGPCIDYTCACGHEKIRLGFNPNISPPVCPECRVEWTHASVRRQFLGSIELISPVTHKWFSDSRGAYIPTLVGITPRTFRNLKECKVFFPFNLEKNHSLINQKYQHIPTFNKTFFVQKSSQRKLQVASSLRAMQTLQLFIDPQKSFDSNLFQILKLANSFRNFWLLSNPLLHLSKWKKNKIFSKFSDVCFLPNTKELEIFSLKSNTITNTNHIGRLPLFVKENLWNQFDKSSYSNLHNQKNIYGEKAKFTKNFNFYSLIRAIKWLSSEKKHSGIEKRVEGPSKKLLNSKTSFFLLPHQRRTTGPFLPAPLPPIEGEGRQGRGITVRREREKEQKVTQKNSYNHEYNKNLVELPKSQNLDQNSNQLKNPVLLPPIVKNLRFKATFPLGTEKQPFQFMQITKTQNKTFSVKKEALKYVLVLAQKKANKLSSLFMEKLSLYTLLKEDGFLNTALQLKTNPKTQNLNPLLNVAKTPEIHPFDFNFEELIKIKNRGSIIAINPVDALSKNGTYICRDFTKYYFNSNKNQLLAFFEKKEKLSTTNFSKKISRKRTDFKTINKYKIGFLSNSNIGLSVNRKLFNLDLNFFQKNYSFSEKIVVKKNLILNAPQSEFLIRDFNVDHNLPIRPSYTQPEDYRGKFLKFFGKNSLIQKTDIPIFRYQTESQIKNNRQFQKIRQNQRFLQKPTTSVPPQALEVYFSEAKSVAKEQTIKKILSQTGGGGLQTYLGVLNLSELVLILQNDISEIAPRLARSYATRRVLLSILKVASNSLKETMVLVRNSPLKTHVLSRSFKGKKKNEDSIINSSVNLNDFDQNKKDVQLIAKNRVPLVKNTFLKNTSLLEPESLLSRENQEGTYATFLPKAHSTFDKASLAQETTLHQLSINNKIEVLEKKCKDVKKEYKAVKKICSDFQNRKNSHKRRYKLAFQLLRTLSNPGGMTMSSVPVLPPGLRPIIDVPKIGPITADLNIRYRSLLFALRNLRELAYVDFRNAGAAQASVQEAVDDLLYTGGKTRREKPSSNPNLYKSLAMRLKGKHGRFRGNLLGKRVDYSGRSVIVVGPTLKIHQCGLPFEIAVKLFNPFLIRSLIQRGFCKNVYKAKQLLIGVKFKPLIWTLCQEVLSEHLVLLNRAPTLHRLGVQAFLPILVSGRAILLHPLVCTGFNADFDGDQMGVHVPLFPQARAEAWKMMWSRNNFLLPSSGEPVLLPSQDMVLGCYYLTSYVPSSKCKTNRDQTKQFIISQYSNSWPTETQLSMFLLLNPFLNVLTTQNSLIPKVTTISKANFENKKKFFWFKKTPFLVSLPTTLTFSLDFVLLQLNFFDKTDFPYLSYLLQQSTQNLQHQLENPRQDQPLQLNHEQKDISQGSFLKTFNSKKSYFNFLFFTTTNIFEKQQKTNSSQNVERQTSVIGTVKPVSSFFGKSFDKKNKEHAFTYARVYNFHERQTRLSSKHEQITALKSLGQRANITPKQFDFFNTKGLLWNKTTISFWSNEIRSLNFIAPISKIGLSQWFYSPRFAFTLSTGQPKKNQSFTKNQIPVLISPKGFFSKARGLGTFYAASTRNVMSFFVENWKQKLQQKQWNKSHYPPFQVLTIETALNFYRKGTYSIQSNVWIYPTKILNKNFSAKVPIYSQKNVFSKTLNFEQQKVEGDGSFTPTLELRITPFGKMRLLHTGAIKTSTFEHLLLLPTRQSVKTPIFDMFIRTTIGRLIFNNLLDEIANS